MSALVAGLDIGSRSIKAVVLSGADIVGQSVASTGRDPETKAIEVLKQASTEAGVTLDRLAGIVGTGYGRSALSLCSSTVTEISCHARANHYRNNAVRTILDMGGQDCKVIRCDDRGHVSNFVMNDKCAAGTGRYLEKVAETLEIPLEDLGPRSLEIIDQPAPVSRYCPILVQQEIIRLLRTGTYYVNDILAGACDAIVGRIMKLVSKVGAEEVFAISGGIARNIGMVTRIESQLEMSTFMTDTPQLMGALGAALFAQDLSATHAHAARSKSASASTLVQDSQGGAR